MVFPLVTLIEDECGAGLTSEWLIIMAKQHRQNINGLVSQSSLIYYLRIANSHLTLFCTMKDPHTQRSFNSEEQTVYKCTHHPLQTKKRLCDSLTVKYIID